MAELDTSLRNTLENQVIKARDVSEAAARNALRALAVHEREARNHMSAEQRALRRALRAKARQLGDPLERDPNAPMPALERELAYERWHQMLFAAFLAHNNLLIHPTENVPVSLTDCDELATYEGDPDRWHTAARYASHMLPGIFRTTDPLLQVTYAPEDHHALERILNDIPPPTYTSDDGLGWVYQFWQTKRKKQVNESGVKIGGADIAPVTQLFTEHYMVQFLLHNTLGAWWTHRHPDTPLPTKKSYLRTLEDGTPAAGTFDGWPNAAKDITVMDPCCGSGHFLIAAFTLLQRFRMIEEGLNEADAGDAVIRDNIHGLELDPRCTQIAAFNLALHAWKHGGYRPLPPMSIACSGTPAGGTEDDWTGLTDDPRAKNALKRLHHLFKHAPDLGSLIDPNRLAEHDPLHTANYDEIHDLVQQALQATTDRDPTNTIFGQAAQGIAHAAQLLAGEYTLVTTNVPYLGIRRQDAALQHYLDRVHPAAKTDLATAFVERCLSATTDCGATAIVSPQSWTTQARYQDFRSSLLSGSSILFLCHLGSGAFGGITGHVVNVTLSAFCPGNAAPDHRFMGLDVSEARGVPAKGEALRDGDALAVLQRSAAQDGARRILVTSRTPSKGVLADFADFAQGIKTGDDARLARCFWELVGKTQGFEFCAGSTSGGTKYSGMSFLLDWRRLGHDMVRPRLDSPVLGRKGIGVSAVGDVSVGLYLGSRFLSSVTPIVPKNPADLGAIWAFAESGEYASRLRLVDRGVAVATGSMVAVPFEHEHWTRSATEQYPSGLPKPYSDDPTQWLFHGHPTPATQNLQVAVARLLGYHWPAEIYTDMELSDEARSWMARAQDLIPFADVDGIVCLPPVAGERPAAARLRDLLAHAYADHWTTTMEATLLATVGYDGKTLHDWLWGDFFKQHCRLFNNRPFIWHITDGVKDGFSALVNYHKLDRALLERLIYTYLGSYIRQQQDATTSNIRGADIKLAKAQELKDKLELILEGEAPYDIFVRWKPLHEQSIGWDPDLNDGVRLNIRPFVMAGVLRNKFTIHWRKDRGNDPTPNATGTTERHNDRHLTLAEKRTARAAVES